MKCMRVLRHEDNEGRFTYDIEINGTICAEQVSKMDAWDWMDEVANDCDCTGEDYEIEFGWA